MGSQVMKKKAVIILFKRMIVNLNKIFNVYTIGFDYKSLTYCAKLYKN